LIPYSEVSFNSVLIPLAEESGGTRGRAALEEDWEDNLTILTTIQWSYGDRGCHCGHINILTDSFSKISAQFFLDYVNHIY
jgi:hypothetical protein